MPTRGRIQKDFRSPAGFSLNLEGGRHSKDMTTPTIVWFRRMSGHYATLSGDYRVVKINGVWKALTLRTSLGDYPTAKAGKAACEKAATLV